MDDGGRMGSTLWMEEEERGRVCRVDTATGVVRKGTSRRNMSS